MRLAFHALIDVRLQPGVGLKVLKMCNDNARHLEAVLSGLHRPLC